MAHAHGCTLASDSRVKGLDFVTDLRDISRDQFDQFGRLTDKSFQIPRELQDMDVVANGGRGT